MSYRDKQMISNYVKIYLESFVNREMFITMTIRYYYIHIRIAIIQKLVTENGDNNRQQKIFICYS